MMNNDEYEWLHKNQNKDRMQKIMARHGKTIAVCSWIQLVPARFCWCLVVPCCHPLRLCSLAMLELGPGSDCGHLEGVLLRHMLASSGANRPSVFLLNEAFSNDVYPLVN